MDDSQRIYRLSIKMNELIIINNSILNVELIDGTKITGYVNKYISKKDPYSVTITLLTEDKLEHTFDLEDIKDVT